MASRISCDFHPQFLNRKFGVDFGMEYQNDPFIREVWRFRAARGLYETFGQYATLFPRPELNESNIDWIGFQPLDFLNAALGGRIEYSSEEEIWTTDKPLAGVNTTAAVSALKDIDWTVNPVYNNLLAQLERMEKARPGVTCGGLQGVCYLGGGKAKLSTHTSYTTAFRLMGEEVFELMMLEPETAELLFKYIFRQYYNQAVDFCSRKGWRLTEIHFGDCAATMLSPALFRSSNAVLAGWIMEYGGFERCTQHSCGPSTHLLEAFQELPSLHELQLGYGTDLQKARKLFPETMITAYYSAAALLNETPEQIKANLRQMTEVMEDNFLIIGSAIDVNTPAENLTAFFDCAEQFNTSKLS